MVYRVLGSSIIRVFTRTLSIYTPFFGNVNYKITDFGTTEGRRGVAVVTSCRVKKRKMKRRFGPPESKEYLLQVK